MTAVLYPDLVTDIDALAALEAPWWALWRRCPAATPFQSPAWLLPWWRAFAPGRLAGVAVRDEGGGLVALAPLYVEADTGRLLPVGIGISDALDVLVDPARAAEAGAALVAGIDRVGGWTTLSFEDLLPDAAALSLPRPGGFTDARDEQGVSPVLHLPEGTGTAEDAIPAAKARKLRMARHRAARRGGAVERAFTASAATQNLDALFRLHAARWRSRGEEGVLGDARVQAFHRDATAGLLEHDLLRSFVLRIEDRVVGVFHGFRGRDTVFAYLGGFDPAFAFESPGTVLIGAAIDDAVATGARAFSFLRGSESYNYEWGARDRPNTRRILQRRNPSGPS